MMHKEQGKELSAYAERAPGFRAGRLGAAILIMAVGSVAATSCAPTNSTDLDGVNASGAKEAVWREAFDAERIGFLSSVWGRPSWQ